MRVGVDCDGVMYDFVEGFSRSVPAPRRGPASQEWDFYKKWGFTTEEFLAFCREGVRDRILFWTGSPFAGSADALRDLRSAGHEIIIITHRGVFGEGEKLAREATEFWLDTHKIEFDELVLAEDKTSIRTDIMVEDNVGNFLALELAGTRSVLMNRAWNQHHETPHRVEDMLGFRDFVLSY